MFKGKREVKTVQETRRNFQSRRIRNYNTEEPRYQMILFLQSVFHKWPKETKDD